MYIIAQIAGGFAGGLLTYGNYVHAIDAYEGVGIRTVPGTAALFSTYAVSTCMDPCLRTLTRIIRLIMRQTVCHLSLLSETILKPLTKHSRCILRRSKCESSNSKNGPNFPISSSEQQFF